MSWSKLCACLLLPLHLLPHLFSGSSRLERQLGAAATSSVRAAIRMCQLGAAATSCLLQQRSAACSLSSTPAAHAPPARFPPTPHTPAVPPYLQDNTKMSMLRNATWTLSNFCRGKPQPDFQQVRGHGMRLRL